MNAPPPAYSLVDQESARRRHSFHPSHQPNHNQQRQQSIDSTPPGTQTRLGRTSQSLSIQPNRPNRHTINTSTQQAQPNQRGLGSLIVGLGAASALNSALNQQSTHHHHSRPSGGEDPLAILARYDTVLLIDDSASMSTQNRWNEAAVAVAGLADTLVQYDNDGIDVYFMNSVEHLRNAVSAKEISMLFQRVQPVGRSTPTDVRVEELLGIYLDRLEAGRANNLPALKPLNLIVITDGEADDPDTLAYALAGFSDRLEDAKFPLNQLGVQFIQIGNDSGATKFLQSLDDELRANSHRRRDIVDTTPYQGAITTQFLIKALLGGINKRIDHQRAL
ncbi:hypothetical protein MJO28_014599 [Puccinia striiformis f. sp. tritici]|uniref:VWFA domain-containing protein n=2 Tax=Puccinia striiformis f. sp. tritici TaxID=168172 RepID=A0A0L0VSR0_9BASI|nr:hypothetical protein Pst134EA_027069 [Puccinia striiformis f. sp. tritici]KAI9625816.1 hypothetical protein H4Q26_016064 [Puccinia striiformis f. sp. tritici PST-130]KNF02323.1 hypothetical protein PSTG_04527 [Puccinia striiformis f. sp. tritici PST-78]KAH9450363.1 hypothetical protein Pst134EA_027069 [Puccinia striiformis f. sp. tritici]KAI7939020.1 hypothetical protein MJO28_014599 [Puccinia striiformis f. sp. tritici]KAI7939733.1 hypothetical protein MJO29_014469 [Puccinia striiformis f.